jgi:hypothetical protein
LWLLVGVVAVGKTQADNVAGVAQEALELELD